MINKGLSLDLLGKHKEAIIDYNKAISIKEKLLEQDPKNKLFNRRRTMSSSTNNQNSI